VHCRIYLRKNYRSAWASRGHTDSNKLTSDRGIPSQGLALLAMWWGWLFKNSSFCCFAFERGTFWLYSDYGILRMSRDWQSSWKQTKDHCCECCWRSGVNCEVEKHSQGLNHVIIPTQSFKRRIRVIGRSHFIEISMHYLIDILPLLKIPITPNLPKQGLCSCFFRLRFVQCRLESVTKNSSQSQNDVLWSRISSSIKRYYLCVSFQTRSFSFLLLSSQF